MIDFDKFGEDCAQIGREIAANFAKRLAKIMEDQSMTLEQLLRMQVEADNAATGKKMKYTPEFRVSVQGERDGGIHFIIHASGHDSDTLDFVARGDELERP